MIRRPPRSTLFPLHDALPISSMEWLETYLSRYSGAMMMVSHDRQFLNRAVNQIFEIDEYDHHLKKYEGNYRSEEHTSELQSRPHLVCRLLLEKKKTNDSTPTC